MSVARNSAGSASRLNDESVVTLLACSPSRPATLRGSALDTITDYPALKVDVDHKKSPGSGYGTARDLARTSGRKLPSLGRPLHR